MTDSQLVELLSALGVVGTALVATLKWSVTRVTKSNDDGTLAIVANTASNAVLVRSNDEMVRSNLMLVSKIDEMVRSFDRIEGSFEQQRPRIKTNPHGTPQWRARSNHDHEDE